MTQVSLDTLSLAALAAMYNERVSADKQIKKFADKATAVKRVAALIEVTPVEAAPADEPLPTSHEQNGSRFDVYAPPADAAKPEKPEYPKYPAKPVQMGDALQQVLGESAKSDVPPPAPVTQSELAARAANKVKTPKAPKPASTGHRGPTPRYADHMRITFIQPNPRRPGAESHERYALYTVGMTVAQYIDLCLQKYGRDRARWLTDVRWDAEAGHIRVEA